MSKSNNDDNGPGGRYYTKPCYLITHLDQNGYINHFEVLEVKEEKPLNLSGAYIPLKFPTKSEAKEAKAFLDSKLDDIDAKRRKRLQLRRDIQNMDKQLKGLLQEQYPEEFMGVSAGTGPDSYQEKQELPIIEFLDNFFDQMQEKVGEPSQRILPANPQKEGD